MRLGKILTLALGGILVLGFVRCGEETTEPTPTKKDGGAPAPGDASTPTGNDASVPTGDGGTKINETTNALCSDGIDNDNNNFIDCKDFGCCKNGVPGAGITVCTECTGGVPADAGVPKPTLDSVEATIAQIRTDTATYADITKFPSVPKKIVTVKNAVVVGSYPHSAGDIDLYIQDPAGGANTGISLNYGKTGVTPAAVGKKVDVTGCVGSDYGVLVLKWCGDDKNTQVTVTETGTATVPAPDAFGAATLGPDSATHEDRLGQPIKVTEDLVIHTPNADECKGTDGKFYCLKLKDAAGSVVFLKTVFTHKCGTKLNGPFKGLVGAWDIFQKADKTQIHSVVPFTCDALINQ